MQLENVGISQTDVSFDSQECLNLIFNRTVNSLQKTLFLQLKLKRELKYLKHGVKYAAVRIFSDSIFFSV